MATHIDIESILKALANRRGLYIFAMLSKTKQLAVGDIAKKIHISIPSTSRHLMQMYKAKLINREQKSLVVYYHLNRKDPKIKSVISLVANLAK